MTPQEAHHVTLCPLWKIGLNTVMFQFRARQNELQSKAIIQDRWNNRKADALGGIQCCMLSEASNAATEELSEV